jgi:hypothetical protein
LNDAFSPVIIEVARKKDYSDFAAFQKTILSNPFALKDKTLRYRSKFYDTTLTLPVDASGLPLIDGTAVDFDSKAVYYSPYLKGDFGGGVVTIQKDGEVLTLDFNKNERSRKR